ncbi:MAG: tetratricopeptide repeat protein [Chthoniobacter sp.]|nr:tetratricopeptide repeat protein [Chthoniobacter sp.]
MPAVTVQQAFDLALRHHQAGRLTDAEALYRQVLIAEPGHAEALHFLGVIAHQTGRHDLAIESIQMAIVFSPNNPAAHSNLGEIFRTCGLLDEAIAAHRRALQLKPDYAKAHHNLGVALALQGQLDEAVTAYRRALELKPDYAEAHNHLGIALAAQGKLNEAVSAYHRALELKPEYAEAHNNLGGTLAEQGQFNEAVAAYRRALQLRPDLAEAWHNLAIVLRDQGQFDQAIAACHHALQLNPNYAEAQNVLGTALAGQGKLDDAVAAYRQALELKPDFPEAQNNLGNALLDRGELDEAAAACRRALQLKPDLAAAYTNLGNALSEQGRLDESLAAYRQAMQFQPQHPLAHSNLIYTLHFHPGTDDRTIAREHRLWNRQFSEPLKRFILPLANDRRPERPLRVGYVSPDFREHVVGRNLWPLFRHHDPRDIEILCYSGVIRPDHLTEKFRERAGQWRNTVGLADEALAEMIRRDSVDILVDLSQHMAGNRLPVFARQPAPVQVSFAGYPSTTGLDAIGYRISDRYLEAGSCSQLESEQVLLIDSFWCYDPDAVEIGIHELPAKLGGRVTFGNLNSFCKVNDPLLKLWARVLRSVKDSRLILLSNRGSHRQRTLDLLEGEGIDRQRIEFVAPRPRHEYLELYHRLDIALDPFPYNGHTTSLDALWMGVPVVSLVGQQAVSRAGLSQLTNLGLPELIAHSEDEYLAIATQLAHDLPRLAELRATLRPRMKASVLMDAPHFARQIEDVYRRIWRQWCAVPAT